MSFRVVVQNATTVLHKKIHVTPLTQLIKTHVTVLLARPTFIHSSATHNLSGRPFSPQKSTTLLPCFLYKSFFYELMPVLSRLLWKSVLSNRNFNSRRVFFTPSDFDLKSASLHITPTVTVRESTGEVQRPTELLVFYVGIRQIL